MKRAVSFKPTALFLRDLMELCLKKCGTEVRSLRRIEGDKFDTTRKKHTEQAKLAASLLGRAKDGSLWKHFFFL